MTSQALKHNYCIPYSPFIAIPFLYTCPPPPSTPFIGSSNELGVPELKKGYLELSPTKKKVNGSFHSLLLSKPVIPTRNTSCRNGQADKTTKYADIPTSMTLQFFRGGG